MMRLQDTWTEVLPCFDDAEQTANVLLHPAMLKEGEDEQTRILQQV